MYLCLVSSYILSRYLLHGIASRICGININDKRYMLKLCNGDDISGIRYLRVVLSMS